MNAISISFGLLIALFTILLLYIEMKCDPDSRSQRGLDRQNSEAGKMTGMSDASCRENRRRFVVGFRERQTSI
jgi:hypothetical protein